VSALAKHNGGGVGCPTGALQLVLPGGHRCQGGPQAGMLPHATDLQGLLPLTLEKGAMQDLAVHVHIDREQGSGAAECDHRILEALDGDVLAKFSKRRGDFKA